MDVCGIDPGLEKTGYAVLSLTGSSTVIRDAGVLTTDRRRPLPERLVELADAFAEVLAQHPPFAVAFEQLYAHYKHPRTAIQMGHARGVLLACAHRAGAHIQSFSATRIKKHLTGNGQASKIQVQRAVQTVFGLADPPEPNDVADAIATAYCLVGELAAATLEDGR